LFYKYAADTVLSTAIVYRSVYCVSYGVCRDTPVYRSDLCLTYEVS